MTRLESINNKIGDLKKLQNQLEIWKIQNKKVVFTNGCFDLLHRGHLTYLAEAAALGDVLIVGVNSDASVKRLKGEKRPILNETDRSFQLSALQFIDFVVVFEEDTPLNLIEFILPDLLVKGGDYNSSESNPENSNYIVGREIMKKKNKEIAVIQFIEGYSTTSMIKKIKNL